MWWQHLRTRLRPGGRLARGDARPGPDPRVAGADPVPARPAALDPARARQQVPPAPEAEAPPVDAMAPAGAVLGVPTSRRVWTERATYAAWAPVWEFGGTGTLVLLYDVRREQELAPRAVVDRLVVGIHPLVLAWAGRAPRGVPSHITLPVDLRVELGGVTGPVLAARFQTGYHDVLWRHGEFRARGITSAAMRRLIAWGRAAYPAAAVAPLKLAEVDGVDPVNRALRNGFYRRLGFTLHLDAEEIAGSARVATLGALRPAPDPGRVLAHPLALDAADALLAAGAPDRVPAVHAYGLGAPPAGARPFGAWDAEAFDAAALDAAAFDARAPESGPNPRPAPRGRG